ncbi:MAG: putative MFS family arabinose efflux permease [Motiliproteus sp.]|jgi:predicted MFS family arabinose efflux permease
MRKRLQSVLINRDVALLATCQALLVTGNVLLVSVTSLIGNRLTTEPILATLPVAMQFGGMMLATLPVSLLMKRIGRRRGFILGNLIGIVGAAICLSGLQLSSLLLFCIGTGLIGACIGISQLYRFAAVDASNDASRHRAIGLVMTGGIVAALVGPNLAVWTREWLPQTLYGGSFIGLIGLYLLTLLALSRIRIPPPSAEEIHGQQRPLSEILRQPVFRVAVFGAMVAYAVMALIMTATPLAMSGCGFGFPSTAGVIQWHVLGMFAPSFLTGHLISRYGIIPIMLTGTVLMIVSVLINLAGVSEGHFTIALLLLGVGWNFLYIGSTSLVTQSYRLAEKAKVQGINDMLVSLAVMLSAFFAGVLHNLFGWQSVNLAMLPLLLLVVAVIVVFHRQRVNALAMSC